MLLSLNKSHNASLLVVSRQAGPAQCKHTHTHVYIFFLQLRGHVLRFIASVLVEVGWSTTSTSSHLGGAADAVRHWHSEHRVSKNIHIHHCMEKL